MKLLIKAFLTVLPALALASCADTHPIKTIGPDTYQVSHTLAKAAPIAGVTNGLVDLGEKKCADEDNAPFVKLGEDVSSTGVHYQTVTLTFQCKPVLGSTQYAPSYADKFSSKLATPFVAPLTPVSSTESLQQ